MSDNNNKNVFLNSKSKPSNRHTNNKKQEPNLTNNRFSNDIGKNTMREIEEKKKEFNAHDEELFPSLLNDYDLYTVSKTNKHNQNIISYKDITKNKETSIKIETDEIEPGWINLFRDENNKIIKMYGKMTPECLEIERKEYEKKEIKERDELYQFLRELEFNRNLRKELFGDIQDFYDPLKDRFYTKENDIVLYTGNDSHDSDTEGSNYDNQETDYTNDDNYL